MVFGPNTKMYVPVLVHVRACVCEHVCACVCAFRPPGNTARCFSANSAAHMAQSP